MARSLKTRGLNDLHALRARTLRQRALGRIALADAEYLTERLDEMEARIVTMREQNENGEEER